MKKEVVLMYRVSMILENRRVECELVNSIQEAIEQEEKMKELASQTVIERVLIYRTINI